MISTLLSIATLSLEASARDCEWHNQQIEHYTNLRRKGGSARQMDYWHKQRNHHKREYSNCLAEQSGQHQTIEVAARNGDANYAPDYRDPRPINTNNQALRKLIETCNYWIREHNRLQTKDTLAQRNTACKAADDGQKNIQTDRPPYVEHTRTLEECIKPNKLIDNQVAECMQGKRYPDWNNPSPQPLEFKPYNLSEKKAPTN